MSNGTLESLRRSELQFGQVGVIKELSVQNGDRVKKGQLIAVLDQFKYLHQLEKARTGYKNAKMELQDVLIGQEYDPMDSKAIPEEVREAASVRSGYTDALSSLEDAQYELSLTVLRAPFDGVVANITQKQYEQVNTADPFCTVMDMGRQEVVFQLTESEITQVSKRDSVKILPIALGNHFSGVITEVNPVVDEFGLVALKAIVQNTGELMDGMHVKVVIEKSIPGQLVVPKPAVVLRQNQKVLFKVVSGKAYWTYLKTALENSTSLMFIVCKNEK